MDNVELPIPSHLKGILIPMGDKNTENRVDGVIRCSCGYETFVVSAYGGKNGENIRVGRYENDFALMVKAECVGCRRSRLIFDMSRHGWNGFVCRDGVTVPDEKLFPWGCKNCGSDIYHITMGISSHGKADFIDESGGEAGEGKEFKESDWIEAFDWITIGLICCDCGFEDERWIDYETM